MTNQQTDQYVGGYAPRGEPVALDAVPPPAPGPAPGARPSAWYVRRYQAKGTFVHVVSPDMSDVLTLSLDEARELAAALLRAAR